MRRRATLLAALLALPLLLIGCPTDDDDSGPEPEPVPEFIDSTLRVSDFSTGDFLVEADVWFEGETVQTDVNGRAVMTIPSQDPFAIRVQMDGGYADHWLAGLAGVEDFQYFARLLARNDYGDVLTALGLAPDPQMGTLIIRPETIALQAAQGSTATIDAASDAPFVFVDGDPAAGNELVYLADSWIVFPNVAPGQVTVDLQAPEGDSCLSFPALNAPADIDTFTVEADAVTVALFICQ
jgi:hypothetical protein